MVYLKRIILPSEHAENKVILREQRTCFNTFYPFKIFPEKGLCEIELDKITMFYGSNGSGKSTLINVLAAKTDAVRYSEFNNAPLFDRYVELCSLEYAEYPQKHCVLTSDDVFDNVLNARTVNVNIDDKRNELIDKYISVKREAITNPEIMRLRGLDDYERWNEVREILSPRHTQSKYIKNRVVRDIDLHSNGETAMQYFIDRIDEDAVYILDEPENSLSVERQLELREYITATARSTNTQFIIATHSPVLLSMRGARIYDLDAYPVSVRKWTELANVRKYFDFFMEYKKEFE